MPVAVATIRGVELRIKIGDGNSPETFAEWCIINTDRGLQMATTGSDEEIPLCDDPESLAWSEHTKTGIGGTISGAGKFDGNSIDDVNTWLLSEDPKNAQIYLGDYGYWQGAWHLTEVNITGTRGTVAAATVSMKSHGIQTWHPTP